MNKFLLFAAALSVTAAAMGQTPVSGSSVVKERSATGKDAKVIKRAGTHVTEIVSADGVQVKRVNMAKKVSNAVNPRAFAKKAVKRSQSLDGSDILFESFEGWDGSDLTWVPDGWTVETYGAAGLEPIQKWHPAEGDGMYYPEATDGKYYYGVVYSEEDQDEWLISPFVTPTDGKNLTFDMNIEPIWFYDTEGDHVDWNKMEFVGEPEIIFNVKVNVRTKDGEWTTELDMAEEFRSMSLMEMFYYNLDASMKPFSVDLSAYVDEEIQIAFEYVGHDGQSYFIDNIRVGYPMLETPVYTMPYSTQYRGFTREFNSVTSGMALLPVNTELSWMSYDYIAGADYGWEYSDPEDASQMLTEEGDELYATYTAPTYFDGAKLNNMYELPTLTVSADDALPCSYQNPSKNMMIGGAPTVVAYTSTDEKVELNMGVVPFDYATEGIGTFTYREEFGMPTVPVFGYSPDVDKYWTDYTFGGDDQEGDGVKLTGILNFIYSSEAPLVVNAADLFAYTQEVGENVEFTCGIYPIDDEFMPMMDEPLATATLAGKDITILEPGDQSPDLSCLTFNFAEPVVLDDTYMAYVVMVSGFNNTDVKYFCPFQSLYPADVPMAMGWTLKEITTAADGTRTSFAPMVDEMGEPMYTSFAINLEACLPWLTSDVEEVEVANAPVEVALSSYYPAEQLTVTAPEWAEVTLTGSNVNTVMTVKATYSEEARTDEIVISAPGVSMTFAISQEAGTGMSGIDQIIAADDDAIKAVYNMAGNRVNAADMPAGVYLIKRASGKVDKVVVK